jgi:hypothetical protein
MAQKGRMYWPAPFGAVSTLSATTGQVPSGGADQFRTLVRAALLACEGEVATVEKAVSLAVMSAGGGAGAPGAVGTTNYVTEISVGRVLDTQRRRRGKLLEAYSPVPAAAGERDGQLRQRESGPA